MYISKIYIILICFTALYSYQKEESIKNQESYTFERRDDYWAKNSEFNRFKFNFEKIKVSAVKDNDALQYEKFKKSEV